MILIIENLLSWAVLFFVNVIVWELLKKMFKEDYVKSENNEGGAK